MIKLIFDVFCLLGNAIGGRKIKNNRLTIKGLTSKDHSRGFLADLKVAATQILVGNFAHISKEKRKVIKALTKDKKGSFTQSIGLGKVISVIVGRNPVQNVLAADFSTFSPLPVWPPCMTPYLPLPLSITLFIETGVRLSLQISQSN